MKTIYIILFLFCTHFLIGQNTFFNFYSDSINIYAGDILELESGTILLPVSTQNDTSWVSALYKFNSGGDIIDVVEFPNNSNEFTSIQKLHLCNDGNLLAFGDYSTGANYIHDLWVLKMDTSFNIINQNRYSTQLSTIAIFNTVTDSYGDVILFSNTQDPLNLWKNFVFRVNQEGDSLYAKIYDTPGLHFACDILECPNDSGYYLFSIWPGLNNNEGKTSIVKVDCYFEVLDIVGTTNNTCNASVRWYNDTSFIVSGQQHKFPEFIDKVGVSIIGESGFVVDEYYWGVEDTVYQPTAYNNLGFHEGNIYYGGVLNFHIPYTTDVSWIILNKLDSNLNPIWQKYIGGDRFYQLFSINVRSDGSCLMTGFGIDLLNGFNNADLFLAKIGPNGEFLSNQEIPQNIMEVKVYPNPGHDYFMLDVQLNGKDQLLELYNMAGVLCHSQALQNGNNRIGTQTLAQGMYIYKVVVDGKTVLSERWVKE